MKGVIEGFVNDDFEESEEYNEFGQDVVKLQKKKKAPQPESLFPEYPSQPDKR